MSKSSSIVAMSLLNRHHVGIRIGRLTFRVYQPYIKDLVRAFSGDSAASWSSMSDNISIDVIARLLYNNRVFQRLFVWYAKRYATYEQIRAAAQAIAEVITGQDIFKVVKVDKVKRNKLSQIVGNNTIVGVMAMIVEYLHLSYRDVYEGINYPTLLLMMTDKARSLGSDEEKVVKISGKDMAERRKKNKR